MLFLTAALSPRKLHVCAALYTCPSPFALMTDPRPTISRLYVAYNAMKHKSNVFTVVLLIPANDVY